MPRPTSIRIVFLLGLAASASIGAAPAADPHAWIARSNAFTQKLSAIEFEHSPESGSREGLAQYDELVSQPSLADDRAERRELEAALRTLVAAETKESDPRVRQDIAILRHAFDLEFRSEDFALAHEVTFYNASERVFQGLRMLLDEQVAPQRRAAALTRLKRYAGLDSGYEPITERWKTLTREQMAKPGVSYPSKAELETELSRDPNYLSGIAALFQKYGLTGWQEPFEKLKTQLAAYDAWVRAEVLPHARTDYRLPPARYALNLEEFGIDLPPARIASMAHAAFADYQREMAGLAKQVAAAHGWPDADYRAVIRKLKEKQITGEAILPFYERRLKDIEALIREHDLVTLPTRPALIRLATAAETAQQPAPHMVPPPFLHNTGQRGVFVLPLNIPSASGAVEDAYDDFTFDAVAWTLTAHEARPGHELQFDSMVEQGVSIARARYAFNSTNAEGWGLYAEYIMQPYEPADGQLLTLQLRLLRAARAFLDPELQSGRVTPEQAYDVLEKDVVLSHAFAKEEVERFIYRAPGQANSYFYGYTRLLELRKQVEQALGPKFSAHEFHDFVLAQGLLPPDLLRKAVLEDFVPSRR